MTPSLARLHPRCLSDVLDDLREARGDIEAALFDQGRAVRGGIWEAEDRVVEAEQRLESLRTEFDTRLRADTGLTVEQLRTAISEALL